jgi:hypothetical protein
MQRVGHPTDTLAQVIERGGEVRIGTRITVVVASALGWRGGGGGRPGAPPAGGRTLVVVEVEERRIFGG